MFSFFQCLSYHPQKFAYVYSIPSQGEPLEVRSGEYAKARLKTDGEMAIDEMGLVHGGFAFSLADYAAMIAVNEPYVVLTTAIVRFTRPVRAGDVLVAEAQVAKVDGRKRSVSVKVSSSKGNVFDGEFQCVVLEKHVLEGVH